MRSNKGKITIRIIERKNQGFYASYTSRLRDARHEGVNK